jgi:hypothetical protein
VKTRVIGFALVAVISVPLLFAQATGASQERVYVKKVMDDGALVVRRNGDAYLQGWLHGPTLDQIQEQRWRS